MPIPTDHPLQQAYNALAAGDEANREQRVLG